MTSQQRPSKGPSEKQTDPQPPPASAPAPAPARRKRGRKFVAIVCITIAAFCATALGGYLLGRGWGGPGGSSDDAPGELAKVTTWYCSMHPQITSPKPGKCGICKMDLIPLEDDNEYLGPRQVSMSLEAMALADIQTTAVTRQIVEKEVRLTGKVDYDETRLVDTTSRIAGRLDKLYVDYTGVLVRKGDHLFDIYSPDLIVGQDELLLAYENYRESTPRNRDAMLGNLNLAEEKLRLWGMLDEQIEEIKRRGKASDHITIYAPVGGIVASKHLNEGAYVKEGTPVYTIADLSLVWIYLDAYESDFTWLRIGQDVQFTTTSYPGEIFKGRITFIDPVLTGKSRVIKVRVNVPNTDLRLKPGMFVQAIVRSPLAVGGRVLDVSLSGKWICPMHQEIVKDGPIAHLTDTPATLRPGERPQTAGPTIPICDICEMPLVPAERLGIIAPENRLVLPLVIPVTAPLPTGKRAVVYVKINPLLLRRQEVLDFSGLVSEILKQAKGTGPSPGKRIWDLFSPELQEQLQGLSSPPVLEPPLKFALLDAFNELLARRDVDDGAAWEGIKKAEKMTGLPPEAVAKLSASDSMLRNRRLIESAFAGQIAAAVDQPTFEGRDVVLGPRAGDYYIVHYGLAENELVVTQGNFKIDADLQIKGKTSMMNPLSLPSPKKPLGVSTAFRVELSPVYLAYLEVTGALAADDVKRARQGTRQLVRAAGGVNDRLLDDEALKHWRYLKNEIAFTAYDTADGLDAAAVRRSFGGLSRAMIRLMEAFGHALPAPVYQIRCTVALDHKGADWLQLDKDAANPYFGPARPLCGEQVASFPSQAPLEVPLAFRRELAGVYGAYLKLQEALADDRLPDAVTAWKAIRPALTAVRGEQLGGREAQAWQATRNQLAQNLDAKLQQAGIDKVRKRFEAVAATMLTLVENFGHVQEVPLSKAFCPMAFGTNKGAAWLQAGSEVVNPYMGQKMLHCGEIQRSFAAAPDVPPKKNPVKEDLR